MRPRKDLVEIFTTFLSFEEHQTVTWQAEPRLKRNLQRTLEQSQSALPSPISATMLTAYWCQIWQPVPTDLPRLHLFAYVQESCYWAVYRLYQRLTNTSALTLYTLPDCFQIAIAEFPKILARFEPSRGANLGTYSEMAFSGILKDQLIQRGAAEICSDWALLRKVSKKRLIEALQSNGFSPEVIQQYSLAWICFRELWVPEQYQQRSSHPPATIWDSVALAYHQVKDLNLPDVSPGQLEQWLQQASKILRAYLYPQINSLNEPLPGTEGRERLDSIVASGVGGAVSHEIGSEVGSEDESLLGQVILAEDLAARHQDYLQLQQILQEALATLKPEWQTSLRLYYQHNQTQSQIAQQLQCSQPSVARYLIKARDSLLAALVTALATGASGYPNKPPTPDRIREQSEALEQWLQVYYGRLAVSVPVAL